MRVSLSPKTQKKIGSMIQAGGYETADDLLCASLAALEQNETFGDFAPGELDALLAEGERSIAKEGTIAAADVFAEIRKLVMKRAKGSARRGKIA